MSIKKSIVTAILFGAIAAVSTASADNPPSKADPTAQTLPTTASATAADNAFGQQGARQRAAHQAARAAAAQEAHKAAAAGPPSSPGVPNSHASAKAQGSGAASHAAAGLDKAATASGGRVHPTGRP